MSDVSACGTFDHGHLCRVCRRWAICGTRLTWTRIGWAHRHCFWRVQHPEDGFDPTIEETRDGVRSMREARREIGAAS